MFPGCRRPAHQAQQDHTIAYQHGGPTLDTNLGPLCARHHTLKTTGGWRLHQPTPGHFTWHTPLRRTYRTRGEPITPPLPEPAPEDPTPDTPEPDTPEPDAPEPNTPTAEPDAPEPDASTADPTPTAPDHTPDLRSAGHPDTWRVPPPPADAPDDDPPPF